jgi:hypothetical protein
VGRSFRNANQPAVVGGAISLDVPRQSAKTTYKIQVLKSRAEEAAIRPRTLILSPVDVEHGAVVVCARLYEFEYQRLG